MNMKRCPRCEVLLALTEENFWKSSTSKDGFQSWCRECSRRRYSVEHPLPPPKPKPIDKPCSRCGRPSSDVEFSFRKDGTRLTYCKQCNSVASGEYRRNNLDKRRRYERERHLKNKVKVMSHYSRGIPSCSCCGESCIYFLHIDHINNDGAKHRKQLKLAGGQRFYDWIIKNNYPDDLQVLCANCDRGKSILGYCPHQADETS